MNLNNKDIHNHILPGVDDGFREVASSIEALRRMSGNGCREIIFTPHMNPDVYPDENEEHFREVYDAFKEQIPSELGLATGLAAEYMVVNGFERRCADHADELLTYPDGSILIEMSYYFRSRNLENAIFELQMAGLQPILAHPERYLYMADKLNEFDMLHDMDCRFQMNMMSLTGCYGRASLHILNYIKKKGWYDFSATDLHSLEQLDRILSAKPVI